MLFYFLRCDEAPEVQLAALSVIVDITSIKDCVASIAESGVMSNILILIEQCPQGHELALEALHALSSNTKIVGELLLKGALLFLLNMFCSSRSPGVRLTVATVFARMAADKLNGPRVTIQLAKFLPPIFMDAMRENAEASVHMFESNQENPELVWDESSRKRVQTEVARMQKLSYEEQLVNATSYKFVLPENFEVTKRRLADVLYSKNIFFFFFFWLFCSLCMEPSRAISWSVACLWPCLSSSPAGVFATPRTLPSASSSRTSAALRARTSRRISSTFWRRLSYSW